MLRPVGGHFTLSASANLEFCFQPEPLRTSFFIARCFGPLSVVSNRPNSESLVGGLISIYVLRDRALKQGPFRNGWCRYHIGIIFLAIQNYLPKLKIEQT